jgi:hypothetical protein
MTTDEFVRDIPWVYYVAPVVLVLFATFEGRALLHPERYNTLSQFIFNIGKRYPITIWLGGIGTGILAVHLFSHWCPS